jgi:hypothetical protein
MQGVGGIFSELFLKFSAAGEVGRKHRLPGGGSSLLAAVFAAEKTEFRYKFVQV